MAGSASNVGALALKQYAQALYATAESRSAVSLLTKQLTAAFKSTISDIDAFLDSVSFQDPTQTASPSQGRPADVNLETPAETPSQAQHLPKQTLCLSGHI